MSFENIVHSGLPSYWLSSGKEIIFNKGNRGQVLDIYGKEYYDFVLGFGPVIIGHNHPIFLEKLTSYLGNGLHLPGYTSFHEQYINKLFYDLDKTKRICFFKTGSEAITGAMRIASMYKKRLGVIRCGFIGWHDAQIGSSVSWHEPLSSPFRNQKRFTENVRGIYGDELVINWASLDLNELEKLLIQHQDKIGTFIIDAYQLAFMSLDTLKTAFKLCKQYNILIIFDETKTGGRYNKTSFAIEYSLDVDMIVMGKSLANGAPLSLIIGDKALMDLTEKVRITGTYSKELLSLYCAMATIDVMDLEDGYNVLYQTGQKVINTFNLASIQAETDIHITAKPFFKGTMFDLEFSSRLISDNIRRKQLLVAMADEGVLLLQGHPSFLCVDHQHINFETLKVKFYNGLCNWKQLANIV